MYSIKNEYETLVKKYHTSLYRLMFTYCGNAADAEDAVQTAYLKFLNRKKPFLSEEHAKNWLYKVAVNYVKDQLKSKWRQTEQLSEKLSFEEEWQFELYDAIRALDGKYRMVILLYYYEGYSVREISGMLSIKESTIQTRLQRDLQLCCSLVQVPLQQSENGDLPIFIRQVSCRKRQRKP